MDFLRDSMNKNSASLISKVVQFSWPPAKAVNVTSGQVVVSIGDSIPMHNRGHEEADTMIVVHALHALKHHVRTVHSDVVAGSFHDMVATQPLADI